jgi:AcrR family transcriptional regulator
MVDQSPPVAPDGRTQRRNNNAERLYDAADELLATRSFDEVSVDDICARANVGRATFFRIYDTKAGLVREFNRRLANDAADRISEAGLTAILDVLDAVRQTVVEAWTRAGRGHVGMAREFVRSVPAGDPHAAHPELLEIVTEHVASAIAAGELPDTVPPDLLGSLALIAITAPLVYANAERDVDIDQLSRTLLGQWHAGLFAEAPRSFS